MIVLISLAWVVVLPICVVVSLFCASKLLGRRVRAVASTGSTDMSAFARQFPTVPDSGSPAPATETEQPLSAA